MRNLGQWVVILLPAADGLVFACVLAARLTGKMPSAHPGLLLLLLLAVPISQYFLRRFGVYDSHRVERPVDIARSVFAAQVCAAAVLVPGIRMLSRDASWHLLWAFLMSAVLLTTVKATVYVGLRFLRRRGFDQRQVLLVGSWGQAERFAGQLREHPEWGLQLDCVLSDGAAGTDFRCLGFPAANPIAANVDDLLRSRVVDEVVVPVEPESSSDAFEQARRFAPYGLQVRIVVGAASRNRPLPRTEGYAGAASIDVAPARLDGAGLAVKRIFDVAISSGLLLALSPLLLAIALTIRLTSPGGVLFGQIRAGLNGRPFRMYKFRTMAGGAEFQVRHLHRSITRGPTFKDIRDYRVTAIGRVLRRFSLDELPQLFNVLRGEMSLVGPRPLPVEEAREVKGEYRRRFSVLPGLTCIWQVSGRSDVAYDQWMRYDLQYVDRWSLWVDSLLLLRTIPAVLSGRGAY